MKLQSVFSEAQRNIITGTSHVALFALAFFGVVGLPALLDLRAVASVIEEAREFRESGASIQVLKADGAIDGRHCDEIALMPGVVSAGALRKEGDQRLVALPALNIASFEGSAGFFNVLRTPKPSSGVAVSSGLGEALLDPGQLALADNEVVPIDSTFFYPEDGRNTQLSFAMVAPAPAVGLFDACWVEVWPSNSPAARFTLLALTSSPTGLLTLDDVEQAQLNPTFGPSFDVATSLHERFTRYAPIASSVLGAGLGFLSIRSRRLEIASNLHAGVAKSALSLQSVLETVTWVVPSAVITLAAAWAVSPSISYLAWVYALRVVTAGSAAALLGSLLGVASCRESRLFSYFKDR